FAYPLNAILGIIFINTALYHGSLGMRVVLEDYVSCKKARHFYIILVNFASIFAAIYTTVSILRLHLIG
ncbi:MAG: succinate dehydrogenase, hydrophobic membrane anchor protein, partial [Proteobacteria bacterium]|nr:succinate dehydrogenase, hydrophobic membrane anchor protein [Pseudomonadota bacterium]